MKKFIVIFGVLLICCANARAEDSQTFIPKKINEAYQDMTVADMMIERFYNHPEDIAKVDAECTKVMMWVDNTLNYGMERYYHNAILCITWEINKNLNKKQIELLVKLKSTFSKVIFDLNGEERISALLMTYINYECTLMLVKKIYNMIYSSSIPICFSNPVLDTPDKQSSVCSTQSSSYLLHCISEENAKPCMDKMITKKFLDNTKQKPLIKTDIYQLNNLTDQFISSLYSDKTQQDIMILDFYDFYIRLIEDAIYEIKYTAEHDI